MMSADESADDRLLWVEFAWLTVVAGVLLVGLTSLGLAWLGAHSAAAVALVTLVAVVVALALVARFHPIDPIVSGADLALTCVLGLVAVAMFFPGSPYAAKNRDPGVYVHHAVAIAREGDTRIPDPLYETDADITPAEVAAGQLVTEEGPVTWRGRAWRGLKIDDDDRELVNPSFLHLWPSLLATSFAVADGPLMYNLGPALGVLSVIGVYLAGRRLFSRTAGVVAAGLLTVNMLQVWQVRYPTAEALTQLLYVAVVLGLAVAVRTGWRPAAALAGASLAAAFLTRVDGLYPLLAGVIVLAAVAAAGRWNPTATAFTAGLAPLVVPGLYQVYDRNAAYATNQRGLVSLPLLVVALVGLAGVALAGAWLRANHEAVRDRLVWATGPGARRALAAVVAVGLALYLVFSWFRPELLGEQMRPNKQGEVTRGYDELNLRRLSWFLTVPGLVLAWGAVVAAVRRPWSWLHWFLFGPALGVFVVLVWDPRIAPPLMWWGRRFVPVVLPALLLLVGAAVAALLGRQGRYRPAAVGAGVVLVAAMAIGMLVRTVPLWSHEEFAGSARVIDQLRDNVTGDDAVLIWEQQAAGYNEFGVSSFMWHDVPTLTGPVQVTAETVAPYAEAVRSDNVYVMTEGPLSDGESAYLTEVQRITGTMERWARERESVPDESVTVPYDLTLSRYTP